MCMIIIDCENLQDIQQEAVNWLRNNAELEEGINVIDHKLFYMLTPTLSKFFMENKLFIKQVQVFEGNGIVAIDEPYMVIPLESSDSPYLSHGSNTVDTSLICTFFKVPEKYTQINNITTF